MKLMITGQLSSTTLAACLLDYLAAFETACFPEGITFRDIRYLKLFLKEIAQSFQAANGDSPERRIADRLVYLNFNHLGFLSYWQELVRAELERAGSALGHLSVLTQELSHLKSLQSKPGIAYHPAWPGIKLMLETWLSDEISIFKLSEKSRFDCSGERAPDDKLVMSLSVAHLACVTRLFYEENCYQSATVTDVLKFTVRHYQSKRQDHISQGSLSKEYYGVTQVTAAVVRDLLHRMINRINKTYFPVWLVISAAYFC
jgi:hypothetical protein